MSNPLIEKFAEEKRWVNWRLETRKGKTTKLPIDPNTGRMASSTDIKTWATHAEALKKNKNVGVVFTPARDLLGIDIDHCVEGDTIKHKQSKAIRALLKAANTYTELSPSRTGLHLYLALSSPLELEANRHEGFEAYTDGRYFTVTAISFGVNRPVRTVSPTEANELLELIGYPWGKGKNPEPITYETPTKTKLDHPSEILEKMFSATNGEEIKKLYDGDTSSYGNDVSRADMALLSHLAFWTQKNSIAMESIWLGSPLGNRKKTQERGDYRTRSIKSAIDRCSEVYTPQPQGESEVKISDPRLKLLYTIKGKQKVYYKNTENISRVIARHPEFEDTFRFDLYRDIIERREVKVMWRELTDNDPVDVQTRISVLFPEFASIGKEMVFDAIIKVAHDHKIDSGADYIKSLKWDEEPRLDSWLTNTYHTPYDEYHQKIGANWIKGMVKRIIEPGSKFDYVLVLEGEQGIRKSTSLLVLAGGLGHVETTMSTETKDFFMQFLGNAIVEFSEGETLSRTEVKRMKAIITVQIDKFRAPYGRVVVPHPRRCVFAMTTNQTEYLKDETGNRRWLPVAVKGNADLEWLQKNREQILAEAYALIKKGETTWEFPVEELQVQQMLRRIQDPNADPIVNWYASLSKSDKNEGITIDQVYKCALNSGFSGPINRLVEMGIADVLRSVLVLDKRRVMVGGARATRWYPTVKSMAFETVEQSELPVSDNF